MPNKALGPMLGISVSNVQSCTSPARLSLVVVRPKRKNMREVSESYRRIGDQDDRFDVEFWQSQGDQAIFAAALEMILDYLILRYGYVDKPRLQRTVESFGKA